MLDFVMYLTMTLFVFVCVILVLLILIQKGRGGGLASAFGGGGGNTAFGSKTGDVLTWATSVVFGVFLLLAIVANIVFNKVDERQKQLATFAPAAAPVEQAPPLLPIDDAPTTAPATSPR